MEKKFSIKILDFIKFISINIIFTFVLLEIPARLYFAKYYRRDVQEKIKSPEIKNYLKYANHIRNPFQNNLKKYTKAPLNSEENSFYIFSKFSDCSNFKNCNTIILQGDSWGEGIETNAYAVLFDSYIKNDWRAYGMGTSSFSPSNHSAQLGYLKSKNIYPKIVISYLDQGDIGDEYFRYRSQVIAPNQNNPFYQVRPFGNTNHLRFYNYSIYKDPLAIYPLSPFFLIKLWDLSMQKVEDISGTYKRLSSTVRWRNVSKPLFKKNQKINNYFKKVLINYIKSAEALGVEELYLVSHKHYRHFYEGVESYEVDIGDLIDNVISNYQSSEQSTKVFHIKTGPRNIKCIEDSCEGYFVSPDYASHPTPSNFVEISKEIKQFLKINSQIKIK